MALQSSLQSPIISSLRLKNHSTISRPIIPPFRRPRSLQIHQLTALPPKGWKSKDLSVGGKEILIKTVAQAIPNYAMSCFLLSIGVCDHLEKLVRDFWWGDSEDKRAIHWVKWDQLKEGTKQGELGFKDFHSFNAAMLAKQVWRLVQNPNGLLNRLLMHKYYRDSTILEAKHSSNISYAFRGLLVGTDLLHRGMRWRVGNGEKIHVFDDRWLPRPTSFSVVTPRPENSTWTTVTEAYND